MKLLRTFSFLYLSINVCIVWSQQIFNSEGWGNTHQTEKSSLVIPLFVLTSDTIYPFEQFGVPDSKQPKDVKVTLPKFESNGALAYSFFYSGAASNGKGGYVPIIVLNYQRRRNEHPIIWVDRNQNFNFTDDGPPDTFYQHKPFIDLVFKNQKNPDQLTISRIGLFDFNKDKAFARMTDQFFRLYQGPRTFVGTLFSFKEYRFVIKEIPILLNNDTFKLGLYDQNFNGIFNEESIDKLLTASINEELFEMDRSFEIMKNQIEIERRLNYYQIKLLDDYGKSVSIFLDTTGKQSWSSKHKMPRFSYQTSDGKIKRISRFRRKPFLIYFWERGSSTFEEDTAALTTIVRKYGEKVEVIMLNFGENPALLKHFVEFNHIQYQVGTATKDILRKYKVDSFPMVYYVGRWRKLGGICKNVQELLNNPKQYGL